MIVNLYFSVPSSSSDSSSSFLSCVSSSFLSCSSSPFLSCDSSSFLSCDSFSLFSAAFCSFSSFSFSLSYFSYEQSPIKIVNDLTSCGIENLTVFVSVLRLHINITLLFDNKI